MKQIISLILILFFFTGCAKQVPVYNGGETGLLAIPWELHKQGGGKMIYHYALHGQSRTTGMAIKIPIVYDRSAFSFSAPLPEGEYEMTKLVTHARVPSGMTASTSYDSYTLNPIPFKINKGTITTFNYNFMITKKMTSNTGFTTSWQLKFIEEQDLKKYRNSLESDPVFSSWTIE